MCQHHAPPISSSEPGTELGRLHANSPPADRPGAFETARGVRDVGEFDVVAAGRDASTPLRRRPWPSPQIASPVAVAAAPATRSLRASDATTLPRRWIIYSWSASCWAIRAVFRQGRSARAAPRSISSSAVHEHAFACGDVGMVGALAHADNWCYTRVTRCEVLGPLVAATSTEHSGQEIRRGHCDWSFWSVGSNSFGLIPNSCNRIAKNLRGAKCGTLATRIGSNVDACNGNRLNPSLSRVSSPF
jgi:hypothetical protein